MSEEKRPVEKGKHLTGEAAKNLDLPVGELMLSIRSRNALACLKVKTVRDLFTKSEQDLLNIKYTFGLKSYREIITLISEL